MDTLAGLVKRVKPLAHLLVNVLRIIPVLVLTRSNWSRRCGPVHEITDTRDHQLNLVFAQIDAARGLKPGDFVTVSVEEPAIEQVVRLPATALDSSGTVLALSADERLEALPVRLERRQGDEVLVRGAELAGREVVAERSPLLGAGVKVRALREEGIPAPEAPALVELTPERRAKLVAFIEGNKMMPADVRERILGQLQEPQVGIGTG